jgi:hypothetical protein
MNFCLELFKRSDIPPINEDDATFLQGEIFLEDPSPRPFVMSLEGSEHVSQRGGFKV